MTDRRLLGKLPYLINDLKSFGIRCSLMLELHLRLWVMKLVRSTQVTVDAFREAFHLTLSVRMRVITRWRNSPQTGVPHPP